MLAPGERCFDGMEGGEKVFVLLPIQSDTVFSYNTGYPMGASSECTVLYPHYLHEWILFVFCLCFVAIHLCET